MAAYTEDQLFAKLERADAAGDTEAAKVIADEIRSVQGQGSNPGAAKQAVGFFDGLQHSVVNAPLGLAQWAGDGVNAAVQAVAGDTAYGRKVQRNHDMQANVVQRREDDYQSRNRGNTGAKVGGFAADLALTAIPASKLGKLSRVARYAGNAGVGAAVGAIDPVTRGETRTQNAVVGAALGALGNGAADVLEVSGRAAAKAVTPQVRKLYQSAKAQGIQLTPAQLSDSKYMGWLRSQVAALPGSGAAGRSAKQLDQFGRAVSRTVGESDPMSHRVFDDALDRTGAEFDRFTSRDLPVNDDLMKSVLAVQDDAASYGDEAPARAMKAIADRVFTQGAGGRLPGEAVQSIDSKLAELMRGGGEKGLYAGRMREALHDHLERNMPRADFEAWQKTRGQYRNLMKIMPLVADNADGAVSPGSLLRVVRHKGSDQRSMARGKGGDLGELARIGQRMKSPPSSGTAERTQATAAGYGMVTSPLKTLLGLTAGRVVGSAADSGLLAKLLMREGRGQTRQALVPYLRPAGIFATPAVNESRKSK